MLMLLTLFVTVFLGLGFSQNAKASEVRFDDGSLAMPEDPGTALDPILAELQSKPNSIGGRPLELDINLKKMQVGASL